jgi:hypothetical protein
MVNGKYIRILRRGVEAWNEWRKEYPHVYVDLTSADFTDADLAGADLARVDLSLAKLVRVDFTNADLMSADLTRVNLTDAKLMDAKLIDAKLTMPISLALFLTVLTSLASTYIRAPLMDCSQHTGAGLPQAERRSCRSMVGTGRVIWAGPVVSSARSSVRWFVPVLRRR